MGSRHTPRVNIGPSPGHRQNRVYPFSFRGNRPLYSREFVVVLPPQPNPRVSCCLRFLLFIRLQNPQRSPCGRMLFNTRNHTKRRRKREEALSDPGLLNRSRASQQPLRWLQHHVRLPVCGLIYRPAHLFKPPPGPIRPATVAHSSAETHGAIESHLHLSAIHAQPFFCAYCKVYPGTPVVQRSHVF